MQNLKRMSEFRPDIFTGDEVAAKLKVNSQYFPFYDLVDCK